MNKYISIVIYTTRTYQSKLQSECAKAVGVSQSQYSRLESGNSEWSVNQLYSISKFLNINMEKIIENAEDLKRADDEIDTKVKEFSDKLESMTSLNDLIHRTLCRVIIKLNAEVGVISLLKEELLKTGLSQAIAEENAAHGTDNQICNCGKYISPHTPQDNCIKTPPPETTGDLCTTESTEYLCTCRGDRPHIWSEKTCAKK